MHAVFSVFPKFYRHLAVEQLAELVREVGLDTTNLVIREGYWVTEEDLATQTPAFVRAMESAGIQVRFATAGFPAEQVIADSTPLSILADNGITEFRMGYFSPGDDPRAAWKEARAQMEQLARICERCRVRGVYQLHASSLITNPTAAYAMLNGLPSEWLGVMIDPGNQVHEGFERWQRSVTLLGDYCVAMGVKDAVLVRDPELADQPDKGWKRRWATLQEGLTNWYEVIEALTAIAFNGTFVFMPFYDTSDPVTMTRKLKAEVAYLRQVMADIGPPA